MDLSLFDLDATSKRRERLRNKIGSLPLVMAAGAPPSRNYEANHYPYRPSSHFLYFIGVGIPGAFALFEDREVTVFVPKTHADDALWHGPSPSHQELAQTLGVTIAPLSRLGDALGGREVAATPVQCAASRSRLTALLGRELDPIAQPLDRDAAEAIVAIRSTHDESAIRELRLAAEATCAAHRAGMRTTLVGDREWTVTAAMEAEIAHRGMSTAYQSIVTTQGQVLHNNHYDGTMADGDLLLADVGAESRGGFAGDVTRTWPVSGVFSSTQREIYLAVRESQAAAIAKIKPGVRYRDIHLAAARSLNESLVELGILTGDPADLTRRGVHALFFPHGIGHLLGLDVHDMEDFGDVAGYSHGVSRSDQFGLSYLRLDRPLEAGMVVTVEPGFYQVPELLDDERRLGKAKQHLKRHALSRFSDVRGIRIEDDVLVTEDGFEVLTANVPKQIAEVEALCAESPRPIGWS